MAGYIAFAYTWAYNASNNLQFHIYVLCYVCNIQYIYIIYSFMKWENDEIFHTAQRLDAVVCDVAGSREQGAQRQTTHGSLNIFVSYKCSYHRIWNPKKASHTQHGKRHTVIRHTFRIIYWNFSPLTQAFVFYSLLLWHLCARTIYECVLCMPKNYRIFCDKQQVENFWFNGSMNL